jgi:hypothetical protein
MPGVFIVNPDNSLKKMTQADYLDEYELQGLIATHPALLGSCTAEKESDERALLLIKREMGVPDQENGNDRWSMDHFYLDRAGIPTLVEVKRSKNDKVRRDVVGQLLDYAANGAAYWSLAAIKEQFYHQWGGQAQAQEQLDAFLGETDEGVFWHEVHENLRRGEIRLVFVADQLPPPLKRVIEFLNEQMREVEVLGIELRQFRNGEQRVIAPSVVGRTSQAEITKGRATASPRTYEELDAVEAAFSGLTDKLQVANHTKHYRQIYLAANVEKGIHYEFLQTRQGVVCDFHVELSTSRPALADAMRSLHGQPIAGAQLERIQRNKDGALRLTPVDQQPAVVAKAMLDFVQATKPALLQAAGA